MSGRVWRCFSSELRRSIGEMGVVSTADVSVMVAAANIASRVLTELFEESGSYVCVLRPLRKLRY